jgi:S-adenosylmethionine:tRNA ribosyltransferase-isomerase
MRPANVMPNRPAMNLTLRDFDYQLPTELIAQHPITPRDQARLLVVERQTGTARVQPRLTHDFFYQLGRWLHPGDVLVVNDSKVIAARLHGTKPSGGKIEVFLLNPIDPAQTQLDQVRVWSCLIRGKVTPGMLVQLPVGLSAIVKRKLDEQTWEVEFNQANVLRIGEVPLPPYITQRSPMSDYQTIYAAAEGSVAAPTAGLHFTASLLQELKAAGVVVAPVTLHVGLGTFAPVKTENIAEHVMHKEYAMLRATTAKIIVQAKQRGNKVIAVGTTACRTLEAFHGQANQGWVDIFITPGYQFNTVDALITNFHLPKSTLLMLVSAFAGKSTIDQAYAAAIKERYRFFSFGDALLLR